MRERSDQYDEYFEEWVAVTNNRLVTSDTSIRTGVNDAIYIGKLVLPYRMSPKEINLEVQDVFNRSGAEPKRCATAFGAVFSASKSGITIGNPFAYAKGVLANMGSKAPNDSAGNGHETGNGSGQSVADYDDSVVEQPPQPLERTKPGTKSVFAWEPSLRPHHAEQLAKRSISKEFALSSGVRSVCDNEVEPLGFRAGLPVDQAKKGLQGICFTYRDIATDEEASWRLKPDERFVFDGKPAKYLSRKGDTVRAYYPSTTKLAMMADTKVNVIMTEGEFKTLALAEKVAPVASRPTCVIGLQGVNGGWHRDKFTVILPTGQRETKKEGAPHLISDLDAWEWKKRVVYIVFDSDVGSRANATEFNKSKRSGAWGAEHTLAQLLRAKGAEVRIVVMPQPISGAKCGADDYIAEFGPHETLKLIYNNWVVDRDPAEALYTEVKTAIKFERYKDLVDRAPARAPSVIEGILPRGAVCVLSGAAGTTKSFILANACQAVAAGEKFLDCLPCTKGPALYIECEMGPELDAERGKIFHDLHEDFWIWPAGKSGYPLNWWEHDGYNKRRETGNRERFMALLEQIRNISPQLIVFDPLQDFCTVPLTDPDAVKHMFQLFGTIASTVKCGVIIAHHNKKTGGREGKYEGQDDSFGSFNIAAKTDSMILVYKYTRADGTSRFKLVFDKLRQGPEIPPKEIEKMSGANSFGWRAIPWDDNTSASLPEDKVLHAIEEGATEYSKICEVAGMSKTTFYRVADRLERAGLIRKDGNLYYMANAR